MLNFAINWLWVDETKDTSNVNVGNNGYPVARNDAAQHLFKIIFKGMVGGEGLEPPTYSV